MRYLTVAVDYTQSPVRDDFRAPIEVEELALPQDLVEALSNWNLRYRRIVPLGPEDRREPETAALISALDHEGQELAHRVSNALGEAKVRYYSEGHLRYEDRP